MSRLYLKMIVISLIIFSVNIQAGWCMDSITEDLNSALRKVTRITKNDKKRHTFIDSEMHITLGKKGKEATSEFLCKHCKKLQSECYGFEGGKLQEIKEMAKTIKSLLENMESEN